MRLLIVGNRGGTNIGDSLLRVAQSLGVEAHLVEMRLAMEASVPVRRFNWRLRGHRPTWLGWFGKSVVRRAAEFRPDWLLTTGLAPVRREALAQIGALGIRRINFLTDDPWNPAHYAPWFLKALPAYDCVFSPRRANLRDLADLGCPQIAYLPFAYDSDLFFPEAKASNIGLDRFDADLIFAGGADSDRVSYLSALIRAGLNVALYGDYWERHAETRAAGRGHADPATLRRAIGAAKIALCLVRRANRDGHSMRTFEVPAVGACPLLEDTEEHRELFGEEGQAAVYFSTIPEMVAKAKWLLEHDTERQQIANASHRLITGGKHTYRDRLCQMLSLPG